MSPVESRYHPFRMKIALAQIASTPGEIDSNLQQHLQVVEDAAARGADLVVFPELSLTGYDVRERARDLSLDARSSVLGPLLEASCTIDIHLGFIERGDDPRIFNSSAYLAGGALQHTHRKTYLPNYGRFQEAGYFAPGDSVRAFDLRAEESRMTRASGRGTLRLGALICEELWHPSVSWLLGQDGAQLLVVQAAASESRELAVGELPSALRAWESLAVSAAIASGAFVILANRVGRENDYYYFGSSFVVGPRGEVRVRAGTLEPELLLFEANLDEVDRARTSMPLLRDERLELTARELDRIVKSRFRLDGSGDHELKT